MVLFWRISRREGYFTCDITFNILKSMTTGQWERWRGSLQLNPRNGPLDSDITVLWSLEGKVSQVRLKKLDYLKDSLLKAAVMIVVGSGGWGPLCTSMACYLLLLSNKMAMDGVPNTETGKIKLIMRGTDNEKNINWLVWKSKQFFEGDPPRIQSPFLCLITCSHFAMPRLK